MQASELQNKFERIRANKWFEAFVISVIVISALLVGAKTYELPAGMSSVTLFLDWFISAFFLTEITIRFLAEKRKRYFFKSFWNWFDTLIVVISLIPADDTELALIARLVRVFRVLRMISIIPELRILLVSLVKALPQLAYVMLLMFIIFYIYAAVGSTLFETINPVLWGDITISMLTLFRIMTFEDWTDVMYEIVVNVMERENEKARAEKEAALLEEQIAQGNVEPTLQDVMKELRELKAQLAANNQNSTVNKTS